MVHQSWPTGAESGVEATTGIKKMASISNINTVPLLFIPVPVPFCFQPILIKYAVLSSLSLIATFKRCVKLYYRYRIVNCTLV
jgi:hypothetical protein